MCFAGPSLALGLGGCCVRTMKLTHLLMQLHILNLAQYACVLVEATICSMRLQALRVARPTRISVTFGPIPRALLSITVLYTRIHSANWAGTSLDVFSVCASWSRAAYGAQSTVTTREFYILRRPWGPHSARCAREDRFMVQCSSSA